MVMESVLELFDGRSGVVEEPVIREALKRLGIKLPRWALLPGGDGEVKLNYPLVVKVASSRILHKSEVGGVRVGVRDEEELEDVLEEMRKSFDGEDLIVEEMVEGKVEMIVGLKYHRDFGPTVMVGVGGFLAELYRDVTFRSAPLTEDEVELAIEDLKGRELLYGYRGIVVDRKDFFRSVSKLSQLAKSLGERLEAMDINPMILNGEGAWAVDVKMILK